MEQSSPYSTGQFADRITAATRTFSEQTEEMMAEGQIQQIRQLSIIPESEAENNFISSESVHSYLSQNYRSFAGARLQAQQNTQNYDNRLFIHTNQEESSYDSNYTDESSDALNSEYTDLWQSSQNSEYTDEYGSYQKQESSRQSQEEDNILSENQVELQFEYKTAEFVMGSQISRYSSLCEQIGDMKLLTQFLQINSAEIVYDSFIKMNQHHKRNPVKIRPAQSIEDIVVRLKRGVHVYKYNYSNLVSKPVELVLEKSLNSFY